MVEVVKQANALVRRQRNSKQGSIDYFQQSHPLPLGFYHMGWHGSASSGLDLGRWNERSRSDLVLGERG